MRWSVTFMSHYTVLVAQADNGPDLETLLDPFDEQLPAEPYWAELYGQEGPDGDLVERARGFYRDNPERLPDGGVVEDVPDIEDFPEGANIFGDVQPKTESDYSDQEIMELYNGGEEVRRNDETGKWEYLSTYNPDSKWDWYVIGGRWSGHLMLRADADPADVEHEASQDPAIGVKNEDPDFCDRARKRAIDIERMRQTSIEQAVETWDAYERIVAEHGPLPDNAWMRELRGKTDEERAAWDAKRDAYWNHPTIRALREHKLIGLLGDPGETFAGTREEFIERARAGAIPCYAFLSEETGWLEPGRMGWFGMSDDDAESRAKYQERINRIVDELPDDTWLTVVDCHI